MRSVAAFPGRCALGCLLVLGLVGCTGGPQADRPVAPSTPPPYASSPSSSSSSSSSTAAPAAADATTTHANVVATRRFSAWLLHAVAMPLGAREWHHSPTAHYREASVGIGPSDVRFTRTTWWTVPLSSEAFGSWLRSHAPHRLHLDSDFGGPTQSRGVWEHDRDFHAPGTPAHVGGRVNFASTPHGEGLVVRVDTFTGARHARTVVVPQDSTSVTIRRTERSTRPPVRRHTTVRTVTGGADVEELVDMVDALPGSMTGRFVTSCPATLSEVSYSMRFATPRGSYVASLPSTVCWPSLTLRHDGVAVGPPIDPGRRFVGIAERFLR